MPLLERRQPVDEVGGDDRRASSLPTATTMSSCGAAAAVRGPAPTPSVAAAGHPRGEVDVVGREVLDHADVGDPVGERALAAGGDLVDVAELARRRAARAALQRRVVALDVADAADQAARARTRRRAAGAACGVVRERLLDQRVRRRPRPARARARVVHGRGGDHAQVDAEVEQCRRRESTTCGARRRPAWHVAGRVGDADQLDARRARGAPGRGGGPSCPRPIRPGAQRPSRARLRRRRSRPSTMRSSSLGVERRVHRQREHLGGGPLGLRQVELERERRAAGGSGVG